MTTKRLLVAATLLVATVFFVRPDWIAAMSGGSNLGDMAIRLGAYLVR